jgi:hypothetical protein
MSLPYRILAAVLIGLGLFLGGYFTGKSNEHNADEAKKGEALEAAVEKHDEVAAVGQEVEHQSTVRAAKTETVFNGIQQGVVIYAQKHPAAADCSLDPDGLRLWRAANDGADADAAGSGQGGVSAAAATGEREHDGSADEPRGGGQAVPPVPGPAQGADHLAGEN